MSLTAPAAPKVTNKKSMQTPKSFIMDDMSELSSLLENLPDSEMRKVLPLNSGNMLYGYITPKTQKKWPYERLLQYTKQGLVLKKMPNNDLEVQIVLSLANTISGDVGKPSCFNKYATRGPVSGHEGLVVFTASKNKETNHTEFHQHITPMTEYLNIPMDVRMGLLKFHFENEFLDMVKNKGTAEEKKTLFVKMIGRYHNIVAKKSYFSYKSLGLLLKAAEATAF